jgi:hypothetical protein
MSHYNDDYTHTAHLMHYIVNSLDSYKLLYVIFAVIGVALPNNHVWACFYSHWSCERGAVEAT